MLTMAFIKYILLAACLQAVLSIKYSSKYRDTGQQWTSKVRRDDNLIFNISTMFEQVGKEYTQDTLTEIVSKNLDYSKNSVEDVWPVKVFNCVGSLGVLDCLKIFLARRVERIYGLVQRAEGDRKVAMNFDNLESELEDFKWEKYKSLKEKQLDAIIYKNMRDLVHKKKIQVVLYPGISIDSTPTGNGSVNVNVKKDQSVDLSRGMKFPKKGFYRIIPILLIPPLIMSAILPFVLPAMKMIIIGVNILNQVALWGAVLTLMRNNVFQDSYEKRVIYVNSGFKNEKKPAPITHHDDLVHGLRETAFLPTKAPFRIPPAKPHFTPHFSTIGYDDESDGDDEFENHEEVFNSFKYNSHRPPHPQYFDEGFEHREKFPSHNFQEDYKRNDRVVNVGR